MKIINKYYCSCGCGGDNCYNRHCTENCWKYNDTATSDWRLRLQREQKRLDEAYHRGYMEGIACIGFSDRAYAMRYALYGTDAEKVRYASISEHELMAKKLKAAMKPLEDLLKEIKP